MATLQTQLEGTVKLKGKQCEMNGKQHSGLNKQTERAGLARRTHCFGKKQRNFLVEFKTLLGTYFIEMVTYSLRKNSNTYIFNRLTKISL